MPKFILLTPWSKGLKLEGNRPGFVKKKDPAMYDLILKGGTVIDGTGRPAFPADVAIKDGAIESVGPDLEASDETPLIEVKGLMVCPGFIDTHSHSDLSLLLDPAADSALFQGVTTEVIGNCGLSTFPAAKETRDQLRSYLAGLGDDGSGPLAWADLAEYAQDLEKRGLGINLVPLVGHGSIRIAVMGFEAREAGPKEMGRMKGLLGEALDQGAIGLSSGLVYPPGNNAPSRELTELAEAATQRGGLYTTHLRGDTLKKGPSLIQSLEEVLDLARRTGIRLHVSHLDPKYPNTGTVGEVLDTLEAAREEGLEVTCDAHPYLAAMTDLASLLPPWVFAGGTRETVRRLTEEPERGRVLAAVRESFSHLDPGEIWSLNELVWPEGGKDLNRLRFDKIGAKLGLDPAEALLTILARAGERLFEIIVLQWIYSAEETEELLAWPWTTVGADGASSTPGGGVGGLTVHPRSWGTFPRYLRWLHYEAARLSLEEAVRKMTGLPAQVFSLVDRGLIRPGMAADLTVFDPKEFKDRATYTDPRRPAQGMRYVLVNGRLAVDQGQRTGQGTGVVLRRG